MAFQPDTGSGGSSDPNTPLQPTQIPTLYDPNKTMRFVQDFVASNTSAIVAPFVGSGIGAATTSLIAADGNRVCVWDVQSSTTANSSISCGLQATSMPHAAKPVLTVYFKMPAVINANTVIQIGTHAASSADRTGLEISGTTCQGKVVIGGTATATGGTYTVTADTWYIGRVMYGGDSSAAFELYSDTGTKLYTYTANTALFAGANIGFRATNSGTAALSMCRVDMMEIVVATPNRFYLSV